MTDNDIQIKGSHNTGNILAGNINVNINPADYKPCPACQRSWVKQEDELCNNCLLELNEYQKKQRRLKIERRARLFVGSSLILTLILTALNLYMTKASGVKNIFHLANNFNYAFYTSLLISIVVMSLIYLLFLGYTWYLKNR